MSPEDLTPPGFCECGCGETPALARASWAAKGRVKGEPLRFIKGHGGHSGGPPPITEREDGCWEWTGVLNVAGYGLVRRNGRHWLAHRWVYSRLVCALDASDVIDHLCRNRACVNPEHLEPVTDAVNTRRGRCAKLTVEQVADIRRCWIQGGQFFVSQRQWAREAAPHYGVAPQTIRNVLSGTTWLEPKIRKLREAA